MKLLKLIFELRFKPKLSFFDHRGRYAELLRDLYSDFKITVGFNEVILMSETETRFIEGKIREQSIGFTIQEVDININDYNNLFVFTDEFVEDYDINEFSRIGVRFIAIGQGLETSRILQNMITGNPVIESERIAGALVEDIAMIYELKQDDYKFRVHCGPVNKNNPRDVNNYIGKIHPSDIETWLHIDCDVFRADVDIKDHKTKTLIKNSLSRAEPIINIIDQTYGK
ncbi:hypothetical protein HQ587_05960 [bacterium]|nr:hypothetical protein [bacterium]